MESSGLVYLLEPHYNNFNKLTNGAIWGHIFKSSVFTEYCNDGNVKPPLYYYQDKDKNEIDLLVEDGSVPHPIEIKTTSDPNKSMTNAFRCIERISDKTVGQGALICMAKEVLPLKKDVWCCL